MTQKLPVAVLVYLFRINLVYTALVVHLATRFSRELCMKSLVIIARKTPYQG